jgi:hypothetical protein
MKKTLLLTMAAVCGLLLVIILIGPFDFVAAAGPRAHVWTPLLFSVAHPEDAYMSLDSNTAFYEGESLNYVMTPPGRFRMVTHEAVNDGYSFAFIPEQAAYDSAEVLIGVNIYKIRQLSFDKVIENDTASLRTHYGKDVLMSEVDSVLTGTQDPVRTFYINSPDRMLPNVMVAYLNGTTELIIFELVVAPTALRFEAEDKFIRCLRNVKMLPKGELGMR